MKKIVTIAMLFTVLMVTMSAHTERTHEAAEGYNAPAMTITTNDTTVSLTDMKGHYVMLTFWDSTDPKSRIAANTYTSLARRGASNERLKVLSVNFDRSERLYREIVRHDGLEDALNVNIAPGQARETLAAAWNLKSGMKSYLIDPQGKIVAVNPTKDQVKKIIG